VYQWCGFKSRRGKNKNLTALKSNSNTVWFNFQTYIYIYILWRKTVRYQRRNQKPWIEEDLTKKWTNRQGQTDKDKQTRTNGQGQTDKDKRTSNHLQNTTQIKCSKTGGDVRYSGRVGSSYFSSVTLVCFDKWQEEFEDTKGVIRIHKSKKDRQYNSQKKKDKRTNNDLQSTTQKTKDWVTRTPRKPEVNSGAPEGLAIPVSILTPVVLHIKLCFDKWNAFCL
jgi:hypothetical protein